MFNRVSPFIIPIRRTATSTDSFTIKTQAWRRGDVVEIHHISVCNESNGSVVCHIGIIRDSFPIYFKTVVLTTATYFYKTILDLFIPSGYKVIVKIITPTSGDKFVVNVAGVIHCTDKD